MFRNKAVTLILLVSFTSLSFVPLAQATTDAPTPQKLEWKWISVPAGYINGNAWVSQEFVQNGFSSSPNQYDFDPTLANVDWSKYPLVNLGYNPFPQYGGITSGIGYQIPYADLMAINPNFGVHYYTYDPAKVASLPGGGLPNAPVEQPAPRAEAPAASQDLPLLTLEEYAANRGISPLEDGNYYDANNDARISADDLAEQFAQSQAEQQVSVDLSNWGGWQGSAGFVAEAQRWHDQAWKAYDDAVTKGVKPEKNPDQVAAEFRQTIPVHPSTGQRYWGPQENPAATGYAIFSQFINLPSMQQAGLNQASSDISAAGADAAKGIGSQFFQNVAQPAINAEVARQQSGGGGLFGGSFLSTVLTVASIALAFMGIPEIVATFSTEALAAISTVKTAMSTFGIASSVISGDIGVGTILSGIGFTGIIPSEVIQVASIAKDVITDQVSPMTFLGPVTSAIGSIIGVPTELGTFDYDLSAQEDTVSGGGEITDDAFGNTEPSADAEAETWQGSGTGYPISQEQADENVEVTPLADVANISGTSLDSGNTAQSEADAGEMNRNAQDAGQRTVAERREAILPKGVIQKQELDADGGVIKNTFIDQKTGKIFLSQQSGQSPILYKSDGTPIETSGGYIQGRMRNIEENTGLPLFSYSLINAIQTNLDTPGKIDVFMDVSLCAGIPATSCSYLGVYGENLQTLYSSAFRATNGYVVLDMVDGSKKTVSGEDFANMSKSSSITGVLIRYPDGSTSVLSNTVYKAIRDQWWKVSGLEATANSIRTLTGDALILIAPSALPGDRSNFYGADYKLYYPPSTSNATQLLQDIKTQAGQLPPEYWNSSQITPRTLGIYSSLNLDSTGAGSEDQDSIWLSSNSRDDYTSVVNRITIAHELSHAFFRDFYRNSPISKLEYQFAYAVYGDEWQSVYGGTSGNEAILAAKSGDNWKMTNYRPDGFIHWYAYKGGPVEDMAATTEMMFTNYPAFKEAAEDDLALATKGRIIRELYAQKVPAMNDAYWDNLKPIDQNWKPLPRLSDGKGGFVKIVNLGDYLQNSTTASLDQVQIFTNVIDMPADGIPAPTPTTEPNLFDPLPAPDKSEQSSWWETLKNNLFGETLPTTDTSSIIKTDLGKVPEAETGLQGGIAENAFGSPSEVLVFSALGLPGASPVPSEIEAKWRQGDFPRPPYLAMPQARYFWNLWGPPGSPTGGSNPPSWWAEYGTTFFPPTSPSEFSSYYCNVGSSGCGAVNPRYLNLPYEMAPDSDPGLISDSAPPLSRASAARQPTIEEITSALNNAPTDESGLVIISQERATALLLLYGSPNSCRHVCPWWWSSGTFSIDLNIDSNPERFIEQFYPNGLIPLPLQQTSLELNNPLSSLQNLAPSRSPTEVVMSLPIQLGAKTYNYVAGATPDTESTPAGTAPSSDISIKGTTVCSLLSGTPCESVAVNSCGQRRTSVYDCAGNCPALPPPESSCPAPTTCQDRTATNFEGSLPCIFPAVTVTEHLQVNPSLMRSGETTKISWAVTNASSCTVTGTNGDGTASSPTGIWNTLSTGGTPKASTAIQGQTTYTLLCASLPGATPASFSESKTVNIIPSYQE